MLDKFKWKSKNKIEVINNKVNVLQSEIEKVTDVIRKMEEDRKAKEEEKANLMQEILIENRLKDIKDVVDTIIKNPFMSTVNIKMIGDSITAGVGSTGYHLTDEPMVNGVSNIPSQDSLCWANLLGKRISKLFSGKIMIEATNQGINYLYKPTVIFQKNRNTKMLARVSCQVGFDFKIKAEQFALYFSMNNASPIIEVKVDGVVKHSIDLYSEDEIFRKKVVINDLTNCEHNVEVIYKERNPLTCSNRILFEGIEVERKVNYKNMGVAGITSKWLDYYREQLISSEDDIIIIQIGTNDRLEFTESCSLKLYLRNTLEYIRLLGKQVILLSSCPVILEEEKYKLTMADIDMAIESLSNSYGISYISNYQGLLEYCRLSNNKMSNLLVDGIHPGDELYFKIKENIEMNMKLPLEII